MAEENKVPQLEEITEEETFNHDEHMDKVQEGLKAIIASNDINEIKEIAQSLLVEENKEKEIEEGNKEVPEKTDVTMKEYLGGK